MVKSMRARLSSGAIALYRPGEMAEWLKAHAWKACVPQGTVGSNPTLSAIERSRHKHGPDRLHRLAFQACRRARTGAVVLASFPGRSSSHSDASFPSRRCRATSQKAKQEARLRGSSNLLRLAARGRVALGKIPIIPFSGNFVETPLPRLGSTLLATCRFPNSPHSPPMKSA
jgi:hypothetical protein